MCLRQGRGQLTPRFLGPCPTSHPVRSSWVWQRTDTGQNKDWHCKVTVSVCRREQRNITYVKIWCRNQVENSYFAFSTHHLILRSAIVNLFLRNLTSLLVTHLLISAICCVIHHFYFPLLFFLWLKVTVPIRKTSCLLQAQEYCTAEKRSQKWQRSLPHLSDCSH